MSKFQSNFQTEGYAYIPYTTDLCRVIPEVLESWKIFCKLPTELKLQIPKASDGFGLGYEFIDTGVNSRTENFDVPVGCDRQIISNSKISQQIYLDFLKKTVKLAQCMGCVTTEFVEKLGIFDSNFSHFIRFIHYSGDYQVGKDIAAAHVDRSGLTFHLFESTKGLKYLSYDSKSWLKLSAPAKGMIVIPAMQMQYGSRNKYIALCHKVVTTEEIVSCGRYAIVCFVSFDDLPKYNKGKYGPLPKFPPGFNYGLSHNDFSKFFEK